MPRDRAPHADDDVGGDDIDEHHQPRNEIDTPHARQLQDGNVVDLAHAEMIPCEAREDVRPNPLQPHPARGCENGDEELAGNR